MIRLMAARPAREDVEPHGPIETEAARRLADDLNTDKSSSRGYLTLSQAASGGSRRVRATVSAMVWWLVLRSQGLLGLTQAGTQTQGRPSRMSMS